MFMGLMSLLINIFPDEILNVILKKTKYTEPDKGMEAYLMIYLKRKLFDFCYDSLMFLFRANLLKKNYLLVLLTLT